MPEKRKKRVGYSKRKVTREQELRQHLMIAAGIAALSLVLIAVFVKFRIGGKKASGTEAAAAVAAADSGPVPSGVEILTDLTRTESAAESLPGEPESAAEEIAAVDPVQSLLIDEMEMKDADLSVSWNLVLVNPKHILPEDFSVERSDIEFSDDDYFVFDSRAVEYLDEMLSDAEAQGFGPYVRSAWRSWGDQEGLLENKIEEWEDMGYSYEEAYETAATYVAIPGTSEHELGLAVDIASDGYDTLNAEQADSPCQQWLTANCANYGFILRYPEDKSDITGIVYEPWHYRYVGKEAAEEIMARGICLEEYLAEKGIGNN